MLRYSPGMLIANDVGKVVTLDFPDRFKITGMLLGFEVIKGGNHGTELHIGNKVFLILNSEADHVWIDFPMSR